MRTNSILITAVVLIFALLTVDAVNACTNILVSRGASRDGSVIITYSADGPSMPRLILVPGGRHKAGSLVNIWGWEDKVIHGQIKQVARTYSVVGLMNEYQVAIGETTTGGRKELEDPKGLLDYDGLMLLALQRSRTAREAIRVIHNLVSEYGYRSHGESLSIADKNEVWLMEIIGKGPKEKGAVWVAARVPEGFITVHANLSRITTFPLDDPENWLYSPDVVDFAVKKGFYDPKSGKPFSFRDAYHPNQSVYGKRVCAGRVWSIYRRVAPDQTFSTDYFRGVKGAEDYPLFLKPTKKLSVQDVMQLMRDHFEGTPYDMTQGIDAGPFSSPYRWRNLSWNLDGKKYHWERPISSQQAGFVMVTQSRNWLPDAVGGVYWFSPDDAFTSCFLPLYCGITQLPDAYARGDHNRFSWDSAWWVWNLVSNLTYQRWSRIYPDVRECQHQCEKALLEVQPAVEAVAAKLAEKDPALTKRYLTDYCTGAGTRLFQRWKDVCTFILTKHNDGYVNFTAAPPQGFNVKDLVAPEKGVQGVNYPAHWLRRVVKEIGERLYLQDVKKP